MKKKTNYDLKKIVLVKILVISQKEQNCWGNVYLILWRISKKSVKREISVSGLKC